MPAPLAKGLIISISILLAAGVAVYESPQVRQWVEESRRKVAMAFHSLGDEISPSDERSSREKREDASTREDSSPEAAERRRKARQDILERGRRLEERRRAKMADAQGRSPSFADFVDKDGGLRSEEQDTQDSNGYTTATENASDTHLRNRTTEAQGTTLGSAMANPFADEFAMDDISVVASPPLPPKPAAYQPQRLIPSLPGPSSSHEPSSSNADTTTNTTLKDRILLDDNSVNLNHDVPSSIAETPSLLDLTPTTTAPGSPALLSPPISAAAISDLSDLHGDSHQHFDRTIPSTLNEENINAWTFQQSQLLHQHPNSNWSDPATPPVVSPNQNQDPEAEAEGERLERAMSELLSLPSHSQTLSSAHSRHKDLDGESDYASLNFSVSEAGHDFDELDDDEEGAGDGMRTPATGTWTEVGSQVSGDE